MTGYCIFERWYLVPRPSVQCVLCLGMRLERWVLEKNYRATKMLANAGYTCTFAMVDEKGPGFTLDVFFLQCLFFPLFLGHNERLLVTEMQKAKLTIT